MLSDKGIQDEPIDQIRSGLDVLRFEWRIWLFFAIASFLAASILMTGWPAGLIPNIHYPYTYTGDGLGHLSLIQRLIEGGWIFFNDRMGFPFGGCWLDSPVPDAGSLLILQALGKFFGSAPAAMNLYFLMSFPVTVICSYFFFARHRPFAFFFSRGGFVVCFPPVSFSAHTASLLHVVFCGTGLFLFWLKDFFLKAAMSEGGRVSLLVAMASRRSFCPRVFWGLLCFLWMFDPFY